jgi:hypothetical protein
VLVIILGKEAKQWDVGNLVNAPVEWTGGVKAQDKYFHVCNSHAMA